LYAYNILDTQQEPSFDTITELAALICGMPVAQINFIDAKRGWSKSSFGALAGSLPRENAICNHTMVHGGLLEIPDISLHEQFSSFITGDPPYRFYAGIPLVDGHGHALGALCVLDYHPGKLSEYQEKALHLLGREVLALIEMRASASAFETFFDIAPELIGICTLQGEFLQLNKGWEQTLGYPLQTLVNTSIAQWVHSDDVAQFNGWIQRVQEGDSARAPQVVRLYHQNGAVHFIEWSASRAGGLLYMIGRDTTQRNESENALRVHQERLELAIEAANEGIWEIDLVTEDILLSPRCRDMLGYTAAEIDGHYETWFALIHPDNRPLLPSFGAIMHGARPALRQEIRLLHKEGRYVDVLIKGKTWVGPNGVATKMAGTMVDISERKAAQKKLLVSEKQLKASLEYTPNVAIQWYNDRGQILYWNRASESLYGWSATETLGKTLDQLINTPEEAQGFLDILHEITRTGEAHGPYESPIIHRDGTPGHVVATTFGIPAEEDRMIFVCMDVDISERKRIEQQLREINAQQALDQQALVEQEGALLEKNAELERLIRFTNIQNDRLREYTYITSHNLRSPIASIMGLCTLLFNEPANASYLSMLDTCVQQLDVTIRKMNDLLEIEKERQTMTWATVNLAHATEQVYALLQDYLSEAVQVIRKIPDDIDVHVIPLYLDSILNNLLTNAIKYRKPNQAAVIEISAERAHQAVIFSITDNGIGMDLETQREKLFKMNSRLTQQAEGHGIGLFFTKYHIEAMGGKIAVESELGIGTTFTVWFYDVPENIGQENPG